MQLSPSFLSMKLILLPLLLLALLFEISFSFLEDKLVPGKSVELEVVGFTWFIGVDVVFVVFDFLVPVIIKLSFFLVTTFETFIFISHITFVSINEKNLIKT